METNKSTGGIFQGAAPQLTFLFGIVTGIVIAGIVCLSIFLPRLGTKTAGPTTTTNSATDTAQTFGNVKPVSNDDYIRGAKNAKVTLVEYSDLECPFCKRFHPVMQQVMDEYGDKVRWVYRQFPLNEIHPNAQKESEAALCVGKLGGDEKYWSFIDKIFERSPAGGTGFRLDDLDDLAKEVGVDQKKFNDCYSSGEMAARVSEETADGTGAGAQGTPTTFLVDKDGKTITAFPGYVQFAQIKAAIDQAL